MSVTLAASSDDRGISIFEHMLALVRRYGVVEDGPEGGAHRLMTLTLGPWTINLWEPPTDDGDEIAAGEAASPGYRNALERQRQASERQASEGQPSDFPYGLEVWRGLKVLSVAWAEPGRTLRIAAFVRGPWESEALALTGPNEPGPPEPEPPE